MPRVWRDALFFLLGGAAGYVAAVTTRASDLPALMRVRMYVLTHRTETFVFLILAGAIIYLAGTGSPLEGREAVIAAEG